MFEGIVGVVGIAAGGGPAEVSHVMFAIGGGGNEGTEFHHINRDFHTDLGKHGLDDLAHFNAGLVVIDPQFCGEPIRITGFGQQFLGLFRIVFTDAGAVVTKNARGDDGISGLAGTHVQGIHQQLAVDGIAQCFADKGVVERGLVHVHGDVPAAQGRDLIGGQSSIVANLRQVIDGQIIGQIDFTGFQSDGTL